MYEKYFGREVRVVWRDAYCLDGVVPDASEPLPGWVENTTWGVLAALRDGHLAIAHERANGTLRHYTVVSETAVVKIRLLR